MSLINKEKVLNGVGKAVDATNKAADKASSFVKEKEIDKKAVKVAKTAEKGIKKAGNPSYEIFGWDEKRQFCKGVAVDLIMQ